MTARPRPTSIVPSVLRRYGIIAALYILLICILPASQKTLDLYNITANQYRVLTFATAIPSLLAWLAAFIGYAKLHDYANIIRDTREGESFAKLAKGTTLIAWALPIPVITAQILNGVSSEFNGFRPAAIIITNLVAVILPVIAFLVIGSAARALTVANGLSFSIKRARSVIVAFIAGGLLYCFLTLKRFDLSSINGTDNPYFLPLWVMMFLIVIPYLYCWFTGLLAAYEILQVSSKAKGVLYRQALQLMAFGIILVVSASIAAQYLYSASPRVGYLVLSYKLVLVSLFRILIGVGFIMVALGANKLRRIEEI